MDSVSNCFDCVEGVFRKTFGPNGVAALIQGPIGNMSVTKCGWAIVQSIYEEDSFKNILVKTLFESMKIVHKTLGDGVKTFLLTEIAFIKKILHAKKENRFSTMKIHQDLQNLYQGLCNTHVPVSNTISLQSREDRVKVTSALFCTSTPFAVSFHLQSVFHDWISIFLSKDQQKYSVENSTSYLEFLLKNFDVLCRGNQFGSRSVSDSYVLTGYLVERKALNLSNLGEESVVVQFYVPDSEIDELEMLFRVNMAIKEKRSEKSSKILLLTTIILTELILFELKKQQVIVLHGVATRDIEFMHQFLHGKDVLYSGVAVKSYMSGIKECTCILMPHIFQMIICAPTDALMCEYIKICKKALKYLLNVSRNNKGNAFVKAGGIFEKGLHVYITKNICRAGDPTMYPLLNRKELLQWHQNKQKLKSSLSSTSFAFNERQHSQSVLLQNQRDLFNVLPEKCEKVADIQGTTCAVHKKSVPESHSSVILQDFQNSEDFLVMNCNLFQDVNRDILEMFAQSLLVFRELLPTDETDQNVFETVSFKLQLLHHVVSTAIMLFKCSAS